MNLANGKKRKGLVEFEDQLREFIRIFPRLVVWNLFLEILASPVPVTYAIILSITCCRINVIISEIYEIWDSEDRLLRADGYNSKPVTANARIGELIAIGIERMIEGLNNGELRDQVIEQSDCFVNESDFDELLTDPDSDKRLGMMKVLDKVKISG